MMDIRALTGPDLQRVIDDVAALRIRVFRDYPYLYDGDMDYERNYMTSYRDSPGAIVVGAFEGARLIGAATGTPMEDHAEEFGAPFQSRGYDLRDIFYCAESVLLSDYRGHGIGHRFFDLREEHARAMGRQWCTFCGVIRPDDHPARPAEYRPLDPFWRKRGYAPLEGVQAAFSWKEIGDDTETTKHLQFWIKRL